MGWSEGKDISEQKEESDQATRQALLDDRAAALDKERF